MSLVQSESIFTMYDSTHSNNSIMSINCLQQLLKTFLFVWLTAI